MSSSEQDRVRELAERVARRLSDEPEQSGGERSEGELAALRASLSEIQRRLAQIESHLAQGAAREETARGGSSMSSSGAVAQTQTQPSAATPTRSTWLSGTYVPAT